MSDQGQSVADPTEIRRVRIARRAFSVAISRSVASPSALVVAGVFYLMVTAVLSGVWRVAAQANGGEIVGYSAAALVWYIATTEASVVNLPQRLIDDIGIDIGSGQIETELLRPASALLVRVSTQLGSALPKVAIAGALGAIFSTVFGGPALHLGALALAVPSLAIGIALNVVAQHAFAAAAFWVLDAKGTWFLYQKMVFLAGGMLMPLEILPNWASGLRFLPFASMTYVPARLASGHLEPMLLAVQVAWLFVMVGIARAVFSAGERHLIEAG